ncbi:MAG: translation initiation factor IF-2 [Halothiobacillaceae bacterium]|jgi:translation initiation factor IF-2|nr:translation initiation factor IF-2 [Halothiobacillaceae bacterium]
MSEQTVKQLAEQVGTAVDRLLEQLEEAGVRISGADAVVSDEDKMRLLAHLRKSHGRDDAPTPGRITLKRRSQEEIKVVGGAGRPKTVNVEYRKKRTYVQRAVIDEEMARQQQAEQAEQAAREAAVISERAEVAEPVVSAVSDVSASVVEPVAPESSEAPLQVETEASPVLVAVAEPVEVAAAAELVPTSPRPAAEPARPGPSAPRPPVAPRLSAEAEEREKAKKAKGHSGKGRHQREVRAARPGADLDDAGGRRGGPRRAKPGKPRHGFEMPTAPVVREVSIPETISVADLAQKMAVKGVDVVKVLFKMGVMATINQMIDQDTAVLVVEEMGHTPKSISDADLEKELLGEVVQGEALSRPPVVTVMGHVDHGKTSLLDYIRRAKVASGEAGGITQHVGAYHVETPRGVVTFLDTPGHEAFTAMRARGAKLTDIVVLVVAADDGVMPQTKEAVMHAQAGEVPIVVAVNKIDKPEADPDRVRNELVQLSVIPEEWGGSNQFVNVSAKTGTGIDELLEAILLQAEVMELTAPATGPAVGVVVESSIEKGRGPVATVLIKSGQLNKGDVVLSGQEYGRVRALLDENGRPIPFAGPSIPAVVLGLSGAPNAGDEIVVLEDERKAREIALFRQGKFRDTRLATQQSAKLENMFEQMKEGEISTLNLLVKADVQGSSEAIRDSLERLSTDEVKVRLIGSGVGGITESDINLAAASKAVVIGFNVRADASARRAAETQGIELRYYGIIYEMLDDVRQAMTGMLSPELHERITGIAEVRDVFRSPKFGAVAGCMVTEGQIKRGNPIRVLRDNVVIYEGELESLRRFKDDVSEVRAGFECGIGVKNYNDVRPGDQIEVFERIEVARTL